MKRITFVFAACLLTSTLVAQQLSEPILQSAQMPMYPVIARFARVTGEVVAEFTLDDSGSVASVQILSGPQLLWRATQENIQTWKFQIPKKSTEANQEYKTTFTYRFSGREVEGDEESGKALKLTVTVSSFHEIEVISDTYKPTMQY
ncbi:MAG: energy transducer TonB [Candidatus Acidoferrales bacterium]|nr:energy transducer TonB [Candidatus Acidoferrales bacterium]